MANNWDKALTIRDEIERLEHEADDLKKAIRLGLPKSLFMPVPRQDLLELLLVQDKIANRTKDVSGLVIGRKLQIPASVAEEFLEFVDRNIDLVIINGETLCNRINDADIRLVRNEPTYLILCKP